MTPGEAADLAAEPGYLSFTDPRISGVVSKAHYLADVWLGGPGYARVERRFSGHPWHHDTGTKGHMGWCAWSASILLVSRDRFSGGGFYFRDMADQPIFHYLDMVLYDGAPENEHYVASNSGERVVLIMFFAGRPDE